MKALEGTAQKKSLITVTPASQESCRTIVVLGVERGGTSMVAGMIRALGVDLGDRAGRNHEDPKFLTDDQDKLLAQIQAYNAQKETWGFKVPKASMMLDFYDKHLRNPHYVLVFRNIEATVDSWCSRGANDPMDSALHAMKYYDAVLQYFKKKKRPLVFVNYERGCDNPVALAADLAEFIGVKGDEDALQKAASIVTGEGGGYLDLPEYYFHIDDVKCNGWPKKALNSEVTKGTEAHFQVSKKKVGDRVIVEPEDDFFPKDFYVGFELTTQDQSLIDEQGLRVYMNFMGILFPGHAFRPPLVKGKNLLKISTNGNVKQIALGALRPGYEFGFVTVKCFAVGSEEESFEYQVVETQASGEPSLLKRVINKIRSL